MTYIKIKGPLERCIAFLLVPFVIILSIPICIFIVSMSPGNPFYIQKRIGKNGRVFKIYKFRTMHINAQEIELTHNIPAGKHLIEDPRIYRGGHFIRRWSLDELTQIFNVLLGNMSFIGPRPAQESEIRMWSDLGHEDKIKIRLQVLPGISGLAQVNGRGDLTIKQKLMYDCYYTRRLSAALDLKIWLKTPVTIVLGHGAY